MGIPALSAPGLQVESNVLATSLRHYTVTVLYRGNILTESQPQKDQSANHMTTEIPSIESDRSGFGRIPLCLTQSNKGFKKPTSTRVEAGLWLIEIGLSLRSI